MAQTRPADVALSAAWVGVLAVDVVLAAADVESDDDVALVTDRLREPFWASVWGVTTLHVLGWLPRWADPFCLVGVAAGWWLSRTRSGLSQE